MGRRTATVVVAVAVGVTAPVAGARAGRGAPAARQGAATPAAPRRAPAKQSGVDPAGSRPRNAVYGEVLGKTGFWGIGYDHELVSRLAVGVTASITFPRDQTAFAVMGYLHSELVTDGHHSWFAEVGPIFADVHADSPVPEWSGENESSVGAELASGYEYRGRFLFRGFLSVTVGSGVVAPWGGAAFGWTF